MNEANKIMTETQMLWYFLKLIRINVTADMQTNESVATGKTL